MFMMIAAAAGIAVAAPALAADPIKIRISTPAVENDWHAKMLTVFKDELEKTAPGEFDVEIHLNGTLFKQGTEPVAMQRGNLHMANLAAFDVQRQIPAWSIVTTPYVFRDHVHMKAVFDSDVGKALFTMMEEKMGIKVLSVPYIGTRHLGLKPKKKIMTPADLAGIKLRMPPGEGWQFVGTAMGANPSPLAFTEVYTALQTGTIDGQDNPMGAVRSMKFYEVTTQIVKTSHLVANNLFAFSLSKWKSLSPAQQKTVQDAADKFAAAVTAQALKDDVEQEAFMKQQGLEVYTPDLAAFRKHVLDVYAKSKFAKDWPAGMLDRINKL